VEVNPFDLGLTLLEVTFVEGEHLTVFWDSSLHNGYPFCEVVLCIRTWAVWNKSRIIGIGLAILILGDLIVQCFLVNKFVVSMECAFFGCHLLSLFDHDTCTDSPSLYPGFRGCFVTHANRALWTNYTLLTIVDAGQSSI
jgi:hypothetical protein